MTNHLVYLDFPSFNTGSTASWKTSQPQAILNDCHPKFREVLPPSHHLFCFPSCVNKLSLLLSKAKEITDKLTPPVIFLLKDPAPTTVSVSCTNLSLFTRSSACK